MQAIGLVIGLFRGVREVIGPDYRRGFEPDGPIEAEVRAIAIVRSDGSVLDMTRQPDCIMTIPRHMLQPLHVGVEPCVAPEAK